MAPEKGDESPKGDGSCSTLAHNGSMPTPNSALAKTTRERGAHWDALYRNAESLLVRLGQDETSFLFRLLDRYLDYLPRMPGMDQGENMVHWMTHFVDETQGHATLQEAAIYLARSRWNITTAIDRWCDEGNHPNIGDEVDSDGEQETESSENGDIVAINLDVDRTAAIKAQVQPDKFLIVIHQLDKKPDKRNEFQAYDRGRSFDWNLSEHIRALNRWRSQILRRNLGSARAACIPFHDDEIEWLYQVHRAFRQAALDRGVAVDWHRIRWNDITTEFNNHFENRILAGDPTPRLARTKASLTTERYRVKRICDLAGLTPKAPTSKNSTKPAPKNNFGEDAFGKDDEGSEEDEDATEDEAVEHQPPSSKGPGRGGPSPRGGFGGGGHGGKGTTLSKRGGKGAT